MTPIILGRGFIIQPSPFDAVKRHAADWTPRPRPITYESTRSVACLPGELSPNDWRKEA